MIAYTVHRLGADECSETLADLDARLYRRNGNVTPY